MDGFLAFVLGYLGIGLAFVLTARFRGIVQLDGPDVATILLLWPWEVACIVHDWIVRD